VRVGSVPVDSYSEPYYADALGLFAKAGLDVQIQNFTSGERMAIAVTAGAIDIALDNPIHLALTIERGASYVLLGGGSLYSSKGPTNAICVAQSSPITTAKALEGNTLAITSRGGVIELGVRAWLAKTGADITKIRLIELANSEMAPALERGTVAAAFIAEPTLTLALQSSVRVLAYFYDFLASHFYINAWFSTPAYAQANPETVKRFMAVIYQTAKWANAHPNDSLQLLARLTKIDPAPLRAMHRARWAESLDENELLPQLTQAVKYGFLDRPITLREMTGRTP
jgi:ABC-type nitrate/sulfonate/bicarbonate transport system substrate-binding protein